ncbi:MAG: DUF748 domain-containing protein, partial [Verrucomicrobiales bacterium]|nr:DUF748 domain-containing protein [Verrucomicrobiales bacterium]
VSTNELLRWKDWSVDGIDVDLEPRRVALGRIRWVEPKASILLDAQGRPNVLAVLRSGISTNTASAGPAPTTNAPSATPNTADRFPIRIAEVGIEGASLHFADRSIEPPCTFDLRRLDATVTGLSSEVGDRAEASLSGIVDEGAPFGLRGRINPLSATPFLDVAFTNQHLQLTAFSPYMEKYAGYPLNKGRLSLDLNYALRDGALDATNKVRLEQLVLGSRNDSPDATQLPVKLAIALLKDSQGVIDLDVPIQGRLDDPKFRIGPIVGQVVGNLIAKVATSPFKLIGALVGGGEELSFVAFDPGASELPIGETNKLAKLVDALGKRPALNLEVEGSADPVLDRDALARAEVRKGILAERLREMGEVGMTPANPTNAPTPTPTPTLDPTDAGRLLRAALVRSGITNVAESLQALARRNASNAVAAARSPAPGVASPSLYRRLTSVFKPGAERAVVRQAHRAAKEDEALLKRNPELAALGVDDMESLLASKTAVAPDALIRLGQDRAKAVQAWLSGPGGIAPDRLFLATPRGGGTRTNGAARVQLSLQ